MTVKVFHMDDARNESCLCGCHMAEGVMHIVACCAVCSFCKQNIAMAYYPAHVEECGKKSLEYFKDIAKKY